MEAPTLIVLIKFLLIFLAIIWVFICFSLIYRKIRTKHLQKIEAAFAEITAGYLYPTPNKPFNLIKANRKFRKLGIHPGNPKNVQYLINLMIRTQRTFLGKNYHKLEILYSQIPPYRVSINKLRSKKWYDKALGIREIYEMGQKQYLQEILKESNHANIYVRRETQIALVVFLGWKSLRFLPYLKKEMTLWQQIKVVEKLHDLYPIANVKYLRRGYDCECPYGIELLMRIIRKFKLIDEVDYIIKFIDSPVYDTRETAMYCISSFWLNQNQIETLKTKFTNIPGFDQQIQLLKYIDRISEEVDLQFFKSLLYTGNENLKLSTAEILWKHGYEQEVEQFYYQQYEIPPQPA